ncbi:MAG: PAS domain-containing protein [Waterburya sp.]
MSTDVFELHIQQSLQKLEDLWRRSGKIPNPDSQLWQNTKELPQQQQELLKESLDELSASIEELQLATETLRQQNEELLTNRQQIVLEKQYYQELFDSAPDCYIITAKNGTIIEVNQKTTELLGVSAKFLTKKSLAVFIEVEQRQEYYTKLNQIQRGEISEAIWKVEITPRKQDSIAVECLVSPIRDRLGEIIALRWRICPIQSNNNVENTVISQNLTPALVKAIRYPIYNLATEIEEIRTSEQSTLLKTDRRLQQINDKIMQLKHTVNDAYIIECLNNSQDFNLSLVDYTIFLEHLTRQIQQRNKISQPIIFEAESSCVGICDILLLEQLVINILSKGSEHITINNQIEINLIKNDSNHLVIAIKLSVKKEIAESIFIKDNIKLMNKNNLDLAVIHKCLDLLQGEIQLESQETMDTTINVKLPLIISR